MQDSAEGTEFTLTAARFMRAVGYDLDSWRSAAACRDIDPDIFFPIGTTGEAVTQTAEAKIVCSGCPVRSSCLRFALATNQQYGIWGGYDEEERREIRRRFRGAFRSRRMAERTAAGRAEAC